MLTMRYSYGLALSETEKMLLDKAFDLNRIGFYMMQ